MSMREPIDGIMGYLYLEIFPPLEDYKYYEDALSPYMVVLSDRKERWGEDKKESRRICRNTMTRNLPRRKECKKIWTGCRY